MDNSIICSLIVLLAMSSFVESCEMISPVVYYNQAFWRKALPFLNETLVDYCYFGNPQLTEKDFGTENVDHYCKLVSNQTQDCYITPQFYEPLQQYYAKLVRNNTKVADRLQVLDCFGKHRTDDQAILAKCWMVDSVRNETTRDASNQTSIRQQFSKTYFNRLSEVSIKIESCLLTKNCHNPRDDFLLALHCALYHSKNVTYVHLPCKSTKFVPPTAPPMDELTIVRYFGHLNGTSIDPEKMFDNIPEAALPYKPLLVSCFAHEEAWIDDPKHECRNITVPVKGVIYSERDLMLQAIFQNVCCRV